MKTRTWIVVAAIVAGMWTVGHADTHSHKHPPLPAGPIHDRHELMEAVGKNAKVIGDAMKAGKFEPVGPAAENIQAAAAQVLPLFPKGSVHEHSRAKAEIWENWDKFEALTNEMGTTAGALAAAAKEGKGIPEAAQAMFGTCKGCHDLFRLPDKNHH